MRGAWLLHLLLPSWVDSCAHALVIAQIDYYWIVPAVLHYACYRSNAILKQKYYEKLPGLVKVSHKCHVDEFQVADWHVGELFMETHQITLRFEFVVDVEDGSFIATFLCVLWNVFRRHKKVSFLFFLFFLLQTNAINNVLLLCGPRFSIAGWS